MCYNTQMSYKVKIKDISYKGAGVAQLNGKVVFVPYTALDEEVSINIVEENSKYAKGVITNIEKMNSRRIIPKCPYFLQCGGCDFQHITYEEELKYKINFLSSEFLKCGYSQAIEVIPSNQRFNYRNKIKLFIFNKELGFFSEHSKNFIKIERCELACDEINEAIIDVANFIKTYDFWAENVIIRKIRNIIKIIFFYKKSLKINENLIKNYFFNKKYEIFLAFGKSFEDGDTIFRRIICGNNSSQNNSNILNSFLQVNDFIANRLYAKLSDCISGKHVINGYSGAGELSLLLARKAKVVYGIECNKNAHQQAEKLKKEKNIENLNNFLGRCEDIIPKIIKNRKIDSIVLDPARSGAKREVLDAIISAKIKECFYISCNPSTLVRDLKILTKNDFIIQNVFLFDMFPCTKSVETLVILKSK